jgi:hypothetical protein
MRCTWIGFATACWAAGARRTTFEHNDHHAGVGLVRITATLPAAIAIVEELRIVAGEAEVRGDSATLHACAHAVAAIFKAIDDGKGT